MRNSDLQVERLSDALHGWSLDVVVSGSIGAVESVRFIRALRRLGAEVTPWLTAGGAQFVTATAVAWAAGREVRLSFAGDASHIACGDACIVAPASASMIAKAAHGLTDTPASALVASYLGAERPVLVLPNMHDSLAHSPGVRGNLATLAGWGAKILGPRLEEAKQKFPEPAVLADHIAHALNAGRQHRPPVLVTMGTTRGYIDSVRYVSNYSSGGLGSLISEELYRYGCATHIVIGPCPIRPRAYTRLLPVETNAEMEAAAQEVLRQGAQAAVLAASVLDFMPKHRQAGKISSRDTDKAGGLTVEFATTPKIIKNVTPHGPGLQPVKVGFKLETGLTARKAQELAATYMPQYQLSLMVINDLSDVDETRHKALVFHAPGAAPTPAASKTELAALVARHVMGALDGGAR